MTKNIFVVGLDDLNLQDLKNIRQAGKYNFLPLLKGEEVRLKLKGATVSYEKLIKRARQNLNRHEGSIDGIISFIDPAMLLTYYLCEEYGQRAPSLKSGIRSEHKYISRKEQAKVIPDNIPYFDIIDPYKSPQLSDLSLEVPFWLKPVISYGAQLAFHIHSQDDLDYSLDVIRHEIDYFSKPYNYLLSIANLPDDIKRASADYCIIEKAVSGFQCTVEGYVYDGNVQIYAFFDSPMYSGSSSFLGYVTPSRLPGSVQLRMKGIAEKIMKQIEFENSPFNIEFYYDDDTDRIWLLEVNSRISESHSYPFSKVYGYSNHQFLVEIATGVQPRKVEKNGEYEYAGKLYHRVFFDDGVVKKIPPPGVVQKIAREYDARIVIQVDEGRKLSGLKGQDSYSYSLADIYLGAQSEKELYQRFDEIVKKLNIVVEELEADK